LNANPGLFGNQPTNPPSGLNSSFGAPKDNNSLNQSTGNIFGEKKIQANNLNKPAEENKSMFGGVNPSIGGSLFGGNNPPKTENTTGSLFGNGTTGIGLNLTNTAQPNTTTMFGAKTETSTVQTGETVSTNPTTTVPAMFNLGNQGGAKEEVKTNVTENKTSFASSFVNQADKNTTNTPSLFAGGSTNTTSQLFGEKKPEGTASIPFTAPQGEKKPESVGTGLGFPQIEKKPETTTNSLFNAPQGEKKPESSTILGGLGEKKPESTTPTTMFTKPESTGTTNTTMFSKPESTGTTIGVPKTEESKTTISKPEEVKIEKTGPKEKDITGISKQESKSHIKLAKLKTISDRQEVQTKLSDIEANSLMNKPVEELLNKWKNELDNEVRSFEHIGGKLNNFERVLHQNFDTVLINNLDKYPQ
jgi:hypothetical protein